MVKVITTLAVACCVTLTGCQTVVQKDWAAISGSRSDGTVKMSFSFDPSTEIPETNGAQAFALAKKRCVNWGYSSAEEFGADIKNCTHTYGSSCKNMVIVREFQCLGRGDVGAPEPAPIPVPVVPIPVPAPAPKSTI